MERVIDELARTFASPSATTWFKSAGNKSPTRDDYRMKVIEFMNLFENALSDGFHNYHNSKDLSDYVKKRIENLAHEILSGKNKDVEKRYKYYVVDG